MGALSYISWHINPVNHTYNYYSCNRCLVTLVIKLEWFLRTKSCQLLFMFFRVCSTGHQHWLIWVWVKSLGTPIKLDGFHTKLDMTFTSVVPLMVFQKLTHIQLTSKLNWLFSGKQNFPIKNGDFPWQNVSSPPKPRVSRGQNQPSCYSSRELHNDSQASTWRPASRSGSKQHLGKLMMFNQFIDFIVHTRVHRIHGAAI